MIRHVDVFEPLNEFSLFLGSTWSINISKNPRDIVTKRGKFHRCSKGILENHTTRENYIFPDNNRTTRSTNRRQENKRIKSGWIENGLEVLPSPDVFPRAPSKLAWPSQHGSEIVSIGLNKHVTYTKFRCGRTINEGEEKSTRAPLKCRNL
jgi:hypothetical protein